MREKDYPKRFHEISGKTFVIDIDGTICSNTDGDYPNAIPIVEAIESVKRLKQMGAEIVFFTARGTTTKMDWMALTESQLELWGVPYDSLIFGKPYGDFYIDDKGVSSSYLLSSLDAQEMLDGL